MQRDHNLPARRSLLSQPQPLGILPTYWFWNDRERQRLVRPIIALVALPVTPLLFLLVVKLQLPIWLLLAGAVYPYLVTGLVERHIRKELLRRPAGTVVSTSAPVTSLDSRDRALSATLTAMCLVFTLLALVNTNNAVMLIAFVVGAAASITASVFPRTRKIYKQLDEAVPLLPPGSNDT